MKPTQPERKRASGTTSPEPDPGIRGSVGVVVSLVQRPDGKVRVVFEDARLAGEGRWSSTGLFTYRDYPTAPFVEMDLHEDEFESAGLSLLTRLVAMARLGEKE